MTKKLVALALMASMGVVALSGCGQTQTATKETAANTATEEKKESAAAPGEDAGFTEIPIGDDQEVGPLNVAAVYFQPVDMEGQTNISAEDYDIHIEADISALENDLGYGVGDWVPYLTVDYDVVDQETGESKAAGTFMEMNATDGPHYGANIKLPDAGTYSFNLKIHSPEENGFLLHVDEETGVTGRFWDEPLEVSFTDWEYVPQEW